MDIVRTAIWTARLEGEKPASIMLIAEQESAKTEVLKYFRGTPTLEYVSDLTQSGIADYKKEIEAGTLKHFVILDLVRVVSHNQTVSGRTIQQLSTLMEEGEANTADGGGRVRWAKSPIIGCLTAITPAYFKRSAGQWRRTGFLSRFLPVAFKYSDETIKLVHKHIREGHKLPEPAAEVMPEKSIRVEIPQRYADQLSVCAEYLGEANKLGGFRYHRQLRAFAKANAIRNGRKVVNSLDVKKITGWANFFTGDVVEL